MSKDTPTKVPTRFSLRTILLYVHLVILALPITGLGVLRIYENELMRRTEAELLAQGAFIGAHYKQCWVEQHKGKLKTALKPAHWITDARTRRKYQSAFRYIPTQVDLNAIKVLPTTGKAPDAPKDWQPQPQLETCQTATSQLMKDAQKITLAGMRIVDTHGVVVASSRGELRRSLSQRQEVQQALKGEVFRSVRERRSDSPAPPLTSLSRRSSVRLFVAMPIVVKGHVVGAVIISRTPLSLTRAIYENRAVLLTFAISLILAVIALSWYTSRTIIRPVRELIDQTQRVGQGDQEAMIPIKNPVTQEVSTLSHSIVEMARALDERSDYIKTFASNVSHEFKTPLTSIRGTVELLWDHFEEMSQEERERFLQIIDRDAERLQRLVNRLLDLARADVFTPGDHATDVAKTINTLIDHHTVRGLHCTLVESLPEQTLVQMDSVTFESIFGNLLDNAKQHGPPDVEVTVRVAIEDTHVVFDVEDNGAGISQANRQKIFKPFFTTARNKGGTGLGLSVISSLIDAHGGTIELIDAKHTHFKVTLPHFRHNN